MIYIYIGYGIFLSLILWFMFCSNLTYHDRNTAMRDQKLTWVDILQVNFYMHVWYRMTFRNPWKLYSQLVRVRLNKVL
jgi:hypothetical protein